MQTPPPPTPRTEPTDGVLGWMTGLVDDLFALSRVQGAPTEAESESRELAGV